MNAKPEDVIGRSVQRIEDRPLIRGEGCFIADVSFPRQLHMRLVRSTAAHGRITRIDASQALALPGVVAVWTAADIPEIGPIDFREGKIEKLEPYRQPVLAHDRVRYVGEPIAAIFAEDAYIAEDGAELVEVEIEELPVIVDARAAPGQFADDLSTEAAIITQGFGDTASFFEKAHAIVEIDVTVGRHSGVPLETRGAIGRYDAARDVLELHGAAKVPHKNKETLARVFDKMMRIANKKDAFGESPWKDIGGYSILMAALDEMKNQKDKP
jgi:carbon-monoxide dehydrogenase large subunit/6-hydroxypseudooxynicotine dehydrogenase subunit gamma